MRRKGQISVFVAVGIMILLIISSYVILSKEKQYGFFGPPGDIKSLVTYTDMCIDTITTEGTFMQRMQGGYIDIPERLRVDERGHINQGFLIPSWYHEGKDYRPTIAMMETQLASYIDESLIDCLNNYEPFLNEFDIQVQGEMKTKVSINENNVAVRVNYPLEVKKIGSDKIYDWTEFKVEVPTRLGKLHALASDLNDYESQSFYLEDYTDEMIAVSDYLPFEGMELDCGPSVFFEKDLKDYFKQQVMHNLNYLQYLKTDYKESGYLYYDKLYKVPFTKDDYSGFTVRTMYDPAWYMDFKALPSKNGIVKPNEFRPSNYINTCLKIFHVRYNVQYPVMFSVMDSDDPEDIFFFSVPVIMRRNQPNRHNQVTPWDIEIEESNNKDSYCKMTDDISLIAVNKDGFMESKPGIKNNRKNELRVYAVDGLYGYPQGVLSDVDVSYQCVRKRCDIGKTSNNETYDGLLVLGSLPKLKTGFPECENGMIIAEKEGYQTAVHHQTVSEETNGEQVTVNMWKLKEFDFTVRVVEEHNGIISDRNLRDNESIMITIENRKEKFDKTLVFPSDSEYFSNLTLMMGPFGYNVSMIMTWDKTLIGGAEYEWSPDINSLVNSNDLIFYVYKKDPVAPVANGEELYKLFRESLDSSKAYPPRFR